MDILVLVSGNPDKPLGGYDIQTMENYLLDYNIVCDHPHWLAPDKAADVRLSSSCNDDRLRDLQELFSARAIDVFCVSSHNRRKKLLLADMDATIVAGETLDDLASHIGIGAETAAITARAMRGELDFKAALLERVGKLKGVPSSVLAETLAASRINQGAQDVVRIMRRHGAACYLVSGGFTYFTGAIAEKCGFDGHHGNTLGIADGVLTGSVEGDILDKNAKLSFLEDYRVALGLDTSQTLTVGDGANDIPMLQAAGLGVGFYPKPLVRQAVPNAILHTDLTSLLYIQGYSWQDITGATT